MKRIIPIPRLRSHPELAEHAALGELLLPELRDPTPDLLAGLVQRLGLRPELWHTRVRFDADSRYYARLASAPTYEVWLLTWLPGQGTGLHDHGESAGAFAVVAGLLRERTPVRLGSGRYAVHERPLPAGTVRSFAPGYVNEIVASTTPSVSIHAYGPALSRMTQYALVDGRLEPAPGATVGRHRD
jgi:hypothetical protein